MAVGRRVEVGAGVSVSVAVGVGESEGLAVAVAVAVAVLVGGGRGVLVGAGGWVGVRVGAGRVFVGAGRAVGGVVAVAAGGPAGGAEPSGTKIAASNQTALPRLHCIWNLAAKNTVIVELRAWVLTCWIPYELLLFSRIQGFQTMSGEFALVPPVGSMPTRPWFAPSSHIAVSHPILAR